MDNEPERREMGARKLKDEEQGRNTKKHKEDPRKGVKMKEKRREE